MNAAFFVNKDNTEFAKQNLSHSLFLYNTSDAHETIRIPTAFATSSVRSIQLSTNDIAITVNYFIKDNKP